jgi:AcrR family transcriptional regulator
MNMTTDSGFIFMAEPAKKRPKTARGEATREAILRAAETVVGARGFNEAAISEITREAGVGQGTFYIYFPSKEAVFRELLLEMGRLTRHTLSEAASAAPDRIAAERAGLAAFLEFVARRPALYRIVEEAQFVDQEAYRAYFQSFADNYQQALEQAAMSGEIRPGDSEVRAWALMGMAKELGERYALWGSDRPLGEVADAAFDLIEHGLKP